MSLNKKERKQLKKTVKGFLVTITSFLTLSSKSMAMTLDTPKNTVTVSGLSPEIIEPLIELVKLAITSSILLAILLLISAGVLRMLRKRKEAIEWTTDILKGFVQILISVPIIFLIYYLVNLLLGGFDVFLKSF